MGVPASLGSVVLALVVLVGAPAAEPAASKTIGVRNDKQLQVAVQRLANSGGTIRLRPGFYRQLMISHRSARRLRIVGRPGVRMEHVLFDRTRNVSLSRVTVRSLSMPPRSLSICV